LPLVIRDLYIGDGTDSLTTGFNVCLNNSHQQQEWPVHRDPGCQINKKVSKGVVNYLNPMLFSTNTKLYCLNKITSDLLLQLFYSHFPLFGVLAKSL